MTDEILQILKESFEVSEEDIGKDAVQKAGPMTFRVRKYTVRGVGSLSFMEGKAMMGLMKMDTAILTPLEKDAPLWSYDRILAMGNDTFIDELYETRLGEDEAQDGILQEIEALKEEVRSVPDYDLGEHWYDSLKLNASISKKGKKCGALLDSYLRDVLACYVKLLKGAPECDQEAKRAKTAAYVDGLIQNGGPATDAFVKSIGREKTEELFRKVIFGIG